jgi:hypothetical protein
MNDGGLFGREWAFGEVDVRDLDMAAPEDVFSSTGTGSRKR